MVDLATWKKGWALLDACERRNAWIVLAIATVAALSSAAMISSIMPFLSVLADPERIHKVPMLAYAYDFGGFASEYSFLAALGLGSLAVIVISNLMQILRAWAIARFALMRFHTLSHRLLASFLCQPYEFFLSRHTGELNAYVQSESQQVVNQFFLPAGEVVASLLTVLSIVAALLWINPQVAIAAFATLGTLYGGTYLIIRRLINRKGRERADANRARFRLADEALGGVKEIKLLGREGAYIDRFRVPSYRMARAITAVQVLGEVPHYVMQAVGLGGMVVLCLALLQPADLASDAPLRGVLPLLGIFAFAGQRLLPELSRLYRGLSQLQFGVASVDGVYRELANKVNESVLPHQHPSALNLKRELTLENVSYRYPDAESASLSNISLTIAAGEKIGVVGSTGAGKTTLGDLALGLLRPTGGRILADGTEIKDVNLRAWQRTLGYVPQEIYLIDASVAENIALGLDMDEINTDQLHRAGRAAQIDTFVRKTLPHGYQTRVGERGIRLSGGQRQRIGIARALYRDADLIVFDEATSALDNLTETEVMTAIESLRGKKTILIIAHRFETVKSCDRIAVLEKGRLVGLGHWEDLMARNAVFRSIAFAGAFVEQPH